MTNEPKIIIESEEALLNELGSLILKNRKKDEANFLLELALRANKKIGLLSHYGVPIERIEFSNINKNDLLNSKKFEEQNGRMFLTLYGLLTYASKFNFYIKDEFIKLLGPNKDYTVKMKPRYRAVLLSLLALRAFSQSLGVKFDEARIINDTEVKFEQNKHTAFYKVYIESFNFLKDMGLEEGKPEFSQGGKLNILVAMKARLTGLDEITSNICDNKKRELYLDLLEDDHINESKTKQIVRLIFEEIQNADTALKINNFLSEIFRKYGLQFYGRNEPSITNTELKSRLNLVIEMMPYS